MIKKYLYYFLLVTILFLFRFFDLIFSSKNFGDGPDLAHIIAPVFKKINAIILSGGTPLFIEELNGGIPYFNSALFSFTYPFYFFNLINYGEGDQLLRTITFISLFHLFLLFIGCIILLRTFAINTYVAIISSFTILLFLNTIFNTNWIIAIAGYSLMPYIFAGVILLFKKEKILLAIILIAFGSLSFLAKPAQTAILSIFFGLIIYLFGFLSAKENRIQLFLFSAALALLVIGLNAPGILMLFMDFSDMIRFTPEGAVQGHDQIPMSAFKSQVDLNEISEFLIVKNKAIGVGHPWIGPIGLLSLFIPIILIKYEKLKFNWIIACIYFITFVTLLFSLGKELPTFNIHYYTPLLNKIRESTRFLFVSNLGVVVLIGLSLNLLHKYQEERKIKVLIRTMVFVSIITMLVQLQFVRNLNYLYPIIIGLGVLFYYFFDKRNNKNAFLVTILTTFVLYSLMLPSGRYPKNSQGYFNSYDNLSSLHTVEKLSKLIEDNHYRVVYHDTIMKDGKWANNAMLYNLRSFQGNPVTLPQDQYDQLWHADNFLNYRLLWGAKHFIYNKESILPADKDFKKLFSTTDHVVYENENALPRVYFAKHVKKFDGDWRQLRRKLEKLKAIRASTYLPTESVEEYNILTHYPDQNENTVLSFDYNNNEFSITTQQSKSGLLVLNEYFSKHWVAKANGNLKDIIKVNTNQMAVLLNKGTHNLTFTYKPYPFLYFYYIQKVCFLILLFLVLLYLRNKFFHKRTESEHLEKQD